jgi:type VI secretion system protein
MQIIKKERLLERIRIMEENPERRLDVDSGTIVHSVLEHLIRVLNTKKGSVEIDPEYGVPDLTNISSSFTSESIPELETAIKSVIVQYEPRLKDVAVHFRTQQDDLLALRFSISAKLVLDEKGTPIVFETIVDSDGQVKVTS